jgi:hypothetical protein
VFQKGLYLISEIQISPGSGLKPKPYINKKNPLLTGEPVLRSDDFKFAFEKGRGRLFFKDQEITKNFGMYTSIYSDEFYKSGKWYASLDAAWEVLDLNKKRLVIKGAWPYLPVIQIWEVKTKKNGFIWKIDMEVFSPTIIQRQQSYIMLSERYSDWDGIDGISGFFPEEFSILQWEGLYRKKDVNNLQVRQKDNFSAGTLPSLSFLCSCDTNIEPYEARVENTNNLFSSRVLGFEQTRESNNQVMGAGFYRYFNGEIAFKKNT